LPSSARHHSSAALARPHYPQQLHRDIRVDDVESAEGAVLALGVRRLPAEHEDGFRVFSDPVGHPLCLVYG
jgi:hypothetical protein